MKRYTLIIGLVCLSVSMSLKAENGYDLWLRYAPISDANLEQNYQKILGTVVVPGYSETQQIIRKELKRAITSMLKTPVTVKTTHTIEATLLIAKLNELHDFSNIPALASVEALGNEGYQLIQPSNGPLLITANSDIGLLYGTFHLLRHMQQQLSLTELNLIQKPRLKLRLLNHWDNLDRTVERGYAGFSIWDWHKLPDYADPRYTDYARANASIGINGTVVTNVNANALVLSTQYLEKLTTLANILRPYGIKVYLTARFSAPVEQGGLKTADPLNTEVQQWWQYKVREIYTLIPDFGGFLVKANSEGQPGPQDYHRTHAQGANLLADAVAPYDGVVIWRAFVYSHEVPDDRHKQANNEFLPLDGKFRDNVLVQVKNGAIDFQPREPFHPLFGSMKQTPLMMEFQITQEYTGCATHLFYQAPLYKETLDSDTWCKGEGSTVASVIDGSLYKNKLTGIAGVSNIGNDFNWTGHPFAQANWYAYGRLAWDYQLSAEEIAKEWLKMTFTTEPNFVESMVPMMMDSREVLVNYMTPIGLHHIMARNHHYGPGPWVTGGRPDWTSVYYHRADKQGLGFDRTATGSNAVNQYFPEVARVFGQRELCPDKYLLWFHHVGWNETLASGRTLWDELCYRYYSGADAVRQMQNQWDAQADFVDTERFTHVAELLKIQAKEARWWRDACILHFQQFSGQPIPEGYDQPAHSLEYYMNIEHRFVPGIKNE
ncbi:MAG: alpha-glucuronidase [Bacteroidetes bacterium HGW-Bacteroidetes-4]|jgi:alpha-glucuronidase|nr:MAG: alpha-glucuronidase [Bacteroidetes bacterium HGW-Bacteroidetes-4]